MNRPRLLAAGLLAAAAFATAAALVLVPFRHGVAPTGAAPAPEEGVLTMLIRRFTREESVSIRIDEERHMRVDRRVARASGGAADGAPAPGSVAFAEDWVVLDHRWLGGGRRADGRAMSYVGASMGSNAHVTVTPPFVVLTRGEESILLRMESGRTVSVDEPMPSWVRSDPDSGLLLARFDGFGDAAIGDGTVHLQRRFFPW